MRILLDHNTPAPLRYWLSGHEVETAYERGWAELSNGELLRTAQEEGFDVLITTDKGIRYQQNLGGRRLALVVISTNDWTRIRKSKSVVTGALSKIMRARSWKLKSPFRKLCSKSTGVEVWA